MENKIKISFVGYNVRSLRISLESLQQLGYSDFSYCLTGESCLQQIGQQPDVIFMDSNDEAFLGLDILKKIKILSPRTRVIMLLDCNKLRVAHHVLRKGAFDYIIKNATEDNQVKKLMIEIQELEMDKVFEQNKNAKPPLFRKILSHNFSPTFKSILS